MRIEGKYMLGTINEIAEEISKNILKNNVVTRESILKFRNCNFALPDDDMKLADERLEIIMDSNMGTYGIKKIATGFDNDDLDLFADYYGGGSGCHNCVGVGDDMDSVISIVQDLIVKTLGVRELCDYYDIIIAEWEE